MSADSPQAKSTASAVVACPELPGPLQTTIERVPALQWPVHFFWCLSQRWSHDRCPLIAAALAFFGLLSVFPIVLAAVAILARVLAGNTEVLTSFQSFVKDFFPGSAGDNLARELTGAVEKIASGPNATTLGAFAVLSLLWSGRAYFDTLAAVLNTVWPHAEPRSFWGHQLALWSTFVGAGALWLLSTALAFALATVKSLNAMMSRSEYFPDFFLFFNRQPMFWDVLGRLSSWLLTLVMFWLMFRFLPNTQGERRGRLALIAALFASIGWEAAKFAFTGFIGNVTRYERTYGGLAGVIVIMMWLYVSSLIILLAAEIAGAFEQVRALRRGEVLEAECDDLPSEQKMPELVDPVEHSKPKDAGHLPDQAR